jgi:thiosulfate/3-mercaptopyruvate sulfurtransferase
VKQFCHASRRGWWPGSSTWVAIGWLIVGGLASGCGRGSSSASREAGQSSEEISTSAEPATPAAQAIPEASLIQPRELAGLLAGPAAQRPALLHVGFRVLYKAGHIAGSRYFGPASRPEGLQALTDALQKLPPNQPVVLYCGCCPWTDCPNMRPAYAAAASAGRTVQILYIAKNLQKDWIDEGLPTENGDQ